MLQLRETRPKSTSKGKGFGSADKAKGKKGGKGKSQKGGKGKYKKVGAGENEGDEQEWDDGYEEEDNDEPEKETVYLFLGMLDELIFVGQDRTRSTRYGTTEEDPP